MSQFDRYTVTEAVEAMREFLGFSKKTFLQDHGLAEESDGPRRGRMPRYPEEAVKGVELLVNKKSARCELVHGEKRSPTTTTLGERYSLARDYLGLNDAEVSRRLGVSRELVRRWGDDFHRPKANHLEALAALLHIPLVWLEQGGEQHLPANSHLGVRVGDEAMQWREQLFGMTEEVISEIPDNADEAFTMATIEWKVFNIPVLANAARRAGGRWQISNGSMFFSPWVPIPEHGLSKRFWTDEVEDIIQEELLSKPTVYGAWEAMRKRCEAMGLGPDEYPKRISLHKRVEKERIRAERFGVDLNSEVAAAVKQYTE